MELLENYFGSLVGAKATMTPKEAKGLPLQNNDMEVGASHKILHCFFHAAFDITHRFSI